MFCPFIKDNCRYDCVFNNGTGVNEDDPFTCNIYESISTITSFGFNKKSLEKYLQEIIEKTEKS